MRSADVRRLLAQRREVKTHSPLPLQEQHPLVEQADQEHGPEKTAQIVAGQRRLALRVDDVPVVVDDADDFQLHGVPLARIIVRPSTCQGARPPCPSIFATC
jgi:hypothetical protein